MLNNIKNDNIYCLSGTIFSTNKNTKGYQFSENEIKSLYKQIKSKIKNGDCIGTLNIPKTADIQLDKVSHIVTDATLSEKNEINCTMKLLDTPAGKLIKNLIDNNCDLSTNLHGVGVVESNGIDNCKFIQVALTDKVE